MSVLWNEIAAMKRQFEAERDQARKWASAWKAAATSWRSAAQSYSASAKMAQDTADEAQAQLDERDLRIEQLTHEAEQAWFAVRNLTVQLAEAQPVADIERVVAELEAKHKAKMRRHQEYVVRCHHLATQALEARIAELEAQPVVPAEVREAIREWHVAARVDALLHGEVDDFDYEYSVAVQWLEQQGANNGDTPRHD